MIGVKFNRLLVVDLLGTRLYGGKKRSFVLCRCDCGIEKEVMLESLTSGKYKSCGCFAVDKATKHGYYGTPEYHTWSSMKHRCNNVNSTRYSNYGGRGIHVCDRWLNFENFIEDMGKRPSRKYSLERRDNDGPYYPDNCYWATDEDQRNNKQNTRYFEYDGKRMSLAQWSRCFNVRHPSQIVRQMDKGKTFEQVATYYEIKKIRKIKSKPYEFSK